MLGTDESSLDASCLKTNSSDFLSALSLLYVIIVDVNQSIWRVEG